MRYRRMPIEAESPEQMGYETIRNNLSESSYSDARLADLDAAAPPAPPAGPAGRPAAAPPAALKDLLLSYGSHQGHEALRASIAKDAGVEASDVLLTIGAAGALFIIATTLLDKDDEVIVVRPNYATNIETPRAIGAAIRYIDLRFEEGYSLDIQRIKAAIGPNTRYLSLTYPHNPTGACLEETALKELISVAEKNNIRLLVDETYRDMTFKKRLPLAASLSPNVISVSSLSKTYGLPGLRVGWIVCRDAVLMETFLAAKEQIHICGPVIDEELAYRYSLFKELHFDRIREDIQTKFQRVKSWIENQEEWEWVEPKGGCVCFPRLRKPHTIDIDKFYEILLRRYGTYVGPGHWFEMPRHYMRIGYGWPPLPRLEEGLEALSKAVREALIP